MPPTLYQAGSSGIQVGLFICLTVRFPRLTLPFSLSTLGISSSVSCSVYYNNPFTPPADMGSCFSGVAHRQFAVGGTSSALDTRGANDAVHSFLKARGYHGLFSQIELSLSASYLLKRGVLFNNDPMAVVYTKGKDGSWQELGRTEVVLNSLHPKWITKINITYYFELVQTLLFRVYDVDTQLHTSEIKTPKLDEQQCLGEATCPLSLILAKANSTCTIDLVSNILEIADSTRKSLGNLTVHAEEAEENVSTTTSELILKCTDLEHKDFFSKTDPFLLISKYTESGTTIPICRTEVLKNKLEPVWKPIFLNTSQVASKDSPLVIECFNFNINGKHVLLGQVQTSLGQLEKLFSNGQGEKLSLPISIGKDPPQTKVLKSQLFVEKSSESVQHSFLDYMSSGWQLKFMVAIDFTSSNENPRLPESLHYIDYSRRPNAYQKAILDVGDVLQYYDYDKLYPSWGFGARIFGGPVDHCFNLNGSIDDADATVQGIQGIMTAYESARDNVTLAGPTLFGPVITSAANIARRSVAANEHKYFVLLIITDGIVTDLQETKNAIVEASYLPLSILIVGVGGADFKEMEILDADNGEKLISSTGRYASRDIVQFVPYRDVQGQDLSVVQSLLAELPSQFFTYMRMNGIQPKAPPPTTL